MPLNQTPRIIQLYRKYVGHGPVDIDRLYDVVLREKRAAEAGIIKVSTGLLCELRADLREISMARD